MGLYMGVRGVVSRRARVEVRAWGGKGRHRCFYKGSLAGSCDQPDTAGEALAGTKDHLGVHVQLSPLTEKPGWGTGCSAGVS